MTEEKKSVPAPAEETVPQTPSRYADLDLLQQEVERRIRDNQRFLERIFDENGAEEEIDENEEADEDEEFEEL